MKRSKHNLSYYKLLTGNMGQLLPIGCTEVLPGDTVQHATSLLVRASPLQTPPMHPVKMKVHHWFVPFRLVWTDWEDFITGGPDGNDASDFPTIDFSGGAVAEGSLADYFGIPTGFAGEVSALPFRAYAKIFNEWYRDQDLVTALALSTASGIDATTSTSLVNGAWEKDYFTTARPWEQKGDDVTLPLLGWADVKRRSLAGKYDMYQSTTNNPAPAGAVSVSVGGTLQSGGVDINLDPNASAGSSALYADLTSASVVGVNDLREAFALQRYKEARARYGSRYTEYLAYLGVRSSDARLQRPEYLGGGSQNLQFSEILQTAGTTDGSGAGVGDLYGHGIGSLRSNRYRKFFEEHGFVISLLQVQPRTMYVQGVNRMFNRRIKEDFWQKELQHIGQQPILNKELYAAHSAPDGVFGYQDRYDEYRRAESSVSGEFRSTLNDWHFARIFGSDPTLNSSFVTSNPAVRPFQDQSSDVLWMMAYHQMVARRMVAKSGTSFIF